MQLTQCPKCKRLVPAIRRTRGYTTRDGHLLTATEIRPRPHLEDVTARRFDLCPMGEMEPEGVAAA